MGEVPQAQGGAQSRWVDRRNLGATLFAIDAATEEEEWERVHSGVGDLARSLVDELSKLNDVIALASKV